MTFRPITHLALSLFLAALAACTSSPRPGPDSATPARHSASARPLRLASWNLEFLAEKDGAGCEPRRPKDYQAMRRIADSLDADVVAFQEAENPAAAARVVDPARYSIVMENRPGAVSGTCGGRHPDKLFIRQAVGFAIRKGLAFERHPDVTSLEVGNPQLRSGIDITLRAAGHGPIRLRGVHLKSGCFEGTENRACPALLQQLPAIEAWIDAAASGPIRFAVLGDWNRRLAVPGDPFWSELDDGQPANASLRLADMGTLPG
ncbi:Endonuclease [Novosphingobium sp. 9U]|nr:Endonuclease [Novosphingobium sp. 9U]